MTRRRYFDIISQPMDLSTMQFKLLGGHYLDRSEFRQDLKLIVANAEAYNVAGIVVQQAHELDAIFEKQWSRVLKTLEGLQYTSQQSNGYDYAPASNKISIPAQSRYRSPSPPPLPPAAPVPTDNFYQPAPPLAPKPIIKLRFAAPQPPPQATPPPAALPEPTPPTQEAAFVASPLPVTESSAPATAPMPSFKFKIKPLAPAPPPPAAVVEPPLVVVAPPVESLPPTPVPAPPVEPAPPALPPPIIKSSGFKIKFNNSSSYSTPPPPPPKPAKVYKPPKIQSFEEDIDEMFTAPKPKPMSISLSSTSNGTPSSHKKKVVSYVDEPSPPMIQEEYIEPVYNLPGRPEILNEPPLPLPSTWFPEDDHVNYKKAKAVLKKIGELPESFFFRFPVEAVGGLVMCVSLLLCGDYD